jgi:GTPase Era involved in 16S rRNA processing
MSVRFLIALALLLVSLLALFVALVATETALSVWQRLGEAPAWLQVAYGLALLGFILTVVYLAWRWLWPQRTKPVADSSPALTEATLQDELLASASAGVDVSRALEEIREQRKRKAGGEVYIALFGEVSTGKSSLVRAMLPEAQALTGARAGTTRAITHYRWRSPAQDAVVLADLPGFNLDDDPALLEEARRAHLVVYLCDEDLTASQAHQLDQLMRLDKPIVLALNKLDQYTGAERQSIIQRVIQQSGLPATDVIAIRSGGREAIIRQLSDGSEQHADRARPADIQPLLQAIQRHLDENRALMESLRETSVLLLASEKLAMARDQHREKQADELVERYSRRAVLGALAAVAPGSDLVIQGVLATRLVQELCRLYGVSVKEVQVESFIRLAGGKVRKLSAITMAIAGNALKAFPGLGTLTGGLLHAVAYGLIFDSLGRAAAETLASRGELRPYPAAETFEDMLSENLASGAERFARLAISQRDRSSSS